MSNESYSQAFEAMKSSVNTDHIAYFWETFQELEPLLLYFSKKKKDTASICVFMEQLCSNIDLDVVVEVCLGRRNMKKLSEWEDGVEVFLSPAMNRYDLSSISSDLQKLLLYKPERSWPAEDGAKHIDIIRYKPPDLEKLEAFRYGRVTAEKIKYHLEYLVDKQRSRFNLSLFIDNDVLFDVARYHEHKVPYAHPKSGTKTHVTVKSLVPCNTVVSTLLLHAMGYHTMLHMVKSVVLYSSDKHKDIEPRPLHELADDVQQQLKVRNLSVTTCKRCDYKLFNVCMYHCPCETACYCSFKCQKADFMYHKRTCQAVT